MGHSCRYRWCEYLYEKSLLISNSLLQLLLSDLLVVQMSTLAHIGLFGMLVVFLLLVPVGLALVAFLLMLIFWPERNTPCIEIYDSVAT